MGYIHKIFFWHLIYIYIYIYDIYDIYINDICVYIYIFVLYFLKHKLMDVLSWDQLFRVYLGLHCFFFRFLPFFK